MLNRNFAVIMNYDNEFDPSEWTLYVKEIVSNTASATDNDDDNGDTNDTGNNYYDTIILGLISFGIIGGGLSAIAGGVLYANCRKNKIRNMRSPPQEGQATPKSQPYCTQCGIKLDPDSIFCHNCGINL